MDKKNLAAIDDTLTTEIASLDSIIDTLNFSPICDFTIPTAEHSVLWKQLEYPGVYLFEIKVKNTSLGFTGWSNEFLNRWQDPEYQKKFTPNSRQGRLNAHQEHPLADWVPIYLGRAKHIGGRIKGHIYLELNKPTTALKLSSRKNMLDETFRISTIPIRVKNYNVIMPRVESLLRDRINPILGRQ